MDTEQRQVADLTNPDTAVGITSCFNGPLVNSA